MFTPPQSLVDAVRNRTLVPFIGAGISVGAVHGLPKEQQFPNWEELIGLLATRLEAEQQLADATKVRATKDMLVAAELAVAALGRKAFLEEMRGAFDRARPPIGADLSVTSAIWRLRAPFVMSTNYDPALGWPWEPHEVLRIHNDDPSHLDTLDAPTGKKRVWHLHGSIERPDTIILTSKHYEKLYKANTPKRLEYDNAFDIFKRLLANRPFLFLGYSLDEPLLRKLLIDVLEITDSAVSRKYLLLRAKQATDAEKEEFRLRYNVEVLEYADFGGPLVDAIDQMGRAVWGDTVDLSLTVLTPDMKVLVTDLLAQVQRLVVPPADIARVYNATKPVAWDSALTGGDSVGMLAQAIVELSRAMSVAPTQPPPLLDFVERLRLEVGEPWLTRFAQWRERTLLRLAPDPVVRAQWAQWLATPRITAAANLEHVLVQINPDAAGAEWMVRAWAWSGTQIPENLFGAAGRRYAAADSEELVYDLVNELEARRVDPSRMTLAFLVPSRLAVDAIHRWRMAGGSAADPPIGAQYTLTVQPAERFAKREAFRRRYRVAWQALKDRATGMLALLDLNAPVPATAVAAYMIDAASAKLPDLGISLEAKDIRCVVLREAPSATSIDALQALINTSTPAIVWCEDGEFTEDMMKQVKRVLESGSLAELPRRIREERLGLFRGEPHRRHVTLIWDDADHLPPDLAAAARAGVEFT